GGGVGDLLDTDGDVHASHCPRQPRRSTNRDPAGTEHRVGPTARAALEPRPRPGRLLASVEDAVDRATAPRRELTECPQATRYGCQLRPPPSSPAWPD